MADRDQFPKAQGPEPSPHAYDNPRIGPRAFLLAVMHDPSAPIRDRMDAASKLLRLFPYDWDTPRLTYVIPEFPSQSHCTEHRGSVSDHPREGETTEINSHFSAIAHKAPSHSGETQGPSNIETTPDPLTFDDIQQIKAVVQRLLPDADLSQTPDHLTLCECGHWMLFPASAPLYIEERYPDDFPITLFRGPHPHPHPLNLCPIPSSIRASRNDAQPPSPHA